MSKFVPSAVIDLLLAGVATATLMTVTDDVSTPTDLTGALADVTMASGDFTIGAGDAGGGSRKVAVAQKANVDIDDSGTALHIVLSLGGTILDVTTCTSQVLTSGGTVTFPTWDHEIADPT